MPSTSDKILIIGGGTFGTSTAWALAQRGYRAVTVLDRWPAPSLEAAGNDLNKVVRTEYPEPLYARLATDAQARWRDPAGLFAGLFHPTGWILGASDTSRTFVTNAARTAATLGIPPPEPIDVEEIHRRWPALAGDLADWSAYWSASGAWVHAAEALRRMAVAAQQAGVTYVDGAAGHAVRLLFDAQAACIGVQCADGTCHWADQVLLAAGAATGSLLDLEGQIVAKGHTVGHIQLTPAEQAQYRDIPMVDHLEGGLLFPPQADGIVKVASVHFVSMRCIHTDIVTNYAPAHPSVSLPRYRSDHPTDGVPEKIEATVRRFVRAVIPALADRPWDTTRICWDGDMPDYHFLITPSPKHMNLCIAAGGSAHGFKFLPVIGEYIVQMMEGDLDADMASKWRWRPDMAKPSGFDDNPHPFPCEDLNTMSEWA